MSIVRCTLLWLKLETFLLQKKKHAESFSFFKIQLYCYKHQELLYKHCALVSSNGLVNPGTELGDTGVHTRWIGWADTASPGHDTNQSPNSILLTDQRTTRVTLKHVKARTLQSSRTSRTNRDVNCEIEIHHARRSTRGSSTDHQISNLGSPVTFAVVIGQQRQSGLLEQGRGIRSWKGRLERAKWIKFTLKYKITILNIIKKCKCKFRTLPLYLVRPHPEVTHFMPPGKLSEVSGRHTGDTWRPSWAGLASLIRMMSLLMVKMLNWGCLKTLMKRKLIFSGSNCTTFLLKH